RGAWAPCCWRACSWWSGRPTDGTPRQHCAGSSSRWSRSSCSTRFRGPGTTCGWPRSGSRPGRVDVPPPPPSPARCSSSLPSAPTGRRASTVRYSPPPPWSRRSSRPGGGAGLSEPQRLRAPPDLAGPVSVQRLRRSAGERVVGLEHPLQDLLVAVAAVPQNRHESRKEARHLVGLVQVHLGDHHRPAPLDGQEGTLAEEIMDP